MSIKGGLYEQAAYYRTSELPKLIDILSKTTAFYRKGEAIQSTEKDGLEIVEAFFMPHFSTAFAGTQLIDMEFLYVGVNMEAAEEKKEEFIKLLDAYPSPDRLAAGPSYIELGAVLGSQDTAFQFMALGQALDIWKVVTPTLLGFSGLKAEEMAGNGMVLITGYRPEKEQV